VNFTGNGFNKNTLLMQIKRICLVLVSTIRGSSCLLWCFPFPDKLETASTSRGNK